VSLRCAQPIPWGTTEKECEDSGLQKCKRRPRGEKRVAERRPAQKKKAKAAKTPTSARTRGLCCRNSHAWKRYQRFWSRREGGAGARARRSGNHPDKRKSTTEYAVTLFREELARTRLIVPPRPTTANRKGGERANLGKQGGCQGRQGNSSEVYKTPCRKRIPAPSGARTTNPRGNSEGQIQRKVGCAHSYLERDATRCCEQGQTRSHARSPGLSPSLSPREKV